MLDADALAVLHALRRDPTRSVQDLGEATGIGRQTVWRIKKRLEREEIILGYGANIDWGRAGWRQYYVVGGGPALTQQGIQRLAKNIRGQGSPLMKDNPSVVLMDLTVTSGQGYDWLIHFVAADGIQAKHFLEFLESVMEGMYDREPLILEAHLPVVTGSKGHFPRGRPIAGLVERLLKVAHRSESADPLAPEPLAAGAEGEATPGAKSRRPARPTRPTRRASRSRGAKRGEAQPPEQEAEGHSSHSGRQAPK